MCTRGIYYSMCTRAIYYSMCTRGIYYQTDRYLVFHAQSTTGRCISVFKILNHDTFEIVKMNVCFMATHGQRNYYSGRTLTDNNVQSVPPT